MKNYLIAIGMSFALATVASAHAPAVKIEKAEKVIVKMGMSAKEKFKIMHCLVVLKKHKTAEEAIEAKMAKIDEKCAKKNLDEEKCNHIKHKVAKKIGKCFLTHEFFKLYFGKGE